MGPVESELRKALSRRTPPAGFTSLLMEEVRTEQRPRKMPWRWVAAGAMAASLSLGVFMQKQHSDRQELVAARQAEEELLLSLQLAGVKINQARDAVWRSGKRGAEQ
jgi:hypothetical protein